MSYNEESQETNVKDNLVKPTTTKRKKKKVDKFTEVTDKIILKEGLTIKEFEKNAIHEARQKLKEKFVEKNIESLL